MKRKWFMIGTLLLLVGFVLAACSSTEPTTVEVTRVITQTVVEDGEPVEVTRVVTETVTETVVETVVETVQVEPEASEEEMNRTGGWLDTIVFVEEPNQDSAVARLAAEDIDMYADDIGGAAAVQAINSADNITAVTQFGLFDEILFNNGTCADESILNPFQNQQIREAMNWAIDRDYVADELYNGLAVPKYTVIREASADRSRFAAEIRALEAEYAYNLERAREVVNAEMEALGAELVDGLWTYNGEPVSVIGLIRTEDTRLEIGNYFANQLEELGFTVERLERTSGELSPLWISSDPLECQWNWYTGGWSQSAIGRDDGSNFDFYYTPRGVPWPSWQVL